MSYNISGRPKDTSCYDSERKVDYEVVKTKDFFIAGIEGCNTTMSRGGDIVEKKSM